MREIKFRAWHRQNRIMRWFNLLWGNTTKPGSGWIGMVDSPDASPHEKWGDNRLQCDPTDYEIMQYTGLKDKNGVEVYDGDCLGGVFGSCYVGWCDKCCSFQLISPLGCMACDGDVHWRELVDSTDLEVIGNIYENPLLLSGL